MSNYILDSQTILFRLILAFFIGMLVGIDRSENWHPDSGIMHSRFTFIKPGKHTMGLGGVRTYTVLAILGFLLGTFYLLDPRTLPLTIVGFVGVVGYVSIAYFLNFFDQHTLGLTTELGMLLLFALTYALGANLLDYRIILGIAVIVSLISNLKVEFRTLFGSFTKKEVRESIEFIAISAVILPWLPNINITIGQITTLFGINPGIFKELILINPFQFWTIVVLISTLNFLGYFLAKLLQSSSSVLVTAFLGGIVSSTSTTQFFADKSKNAKSIANTRLLTAAVLIANTTSFIRIPLIALVINPTVFWRLSPSLLILTIVTTIIAFSLRKESTAKENAPAIFTSPFALAPAIQFGLLFLLVSIGTGLGTILLGNTGFIATALLASLSGLDAVTIVTAKAAPASISYLIADGVIFGSVITNLIFKLGIVTIYGEKKFKQLSYLWLGAITLLGAALLAAILIF